MTTDSWEYVSQNDFVGSTAWIFMTHTCHRIEGVTNMADLWPVKNTSYIILFPILRVIFKFYFVLVNNHTIKNGIVSSVIFNTIMNS